MPNHQKIVVHNNTINGGINVIVFPDDLAIDVNDMARKLVPEGRPYAIMELGDLPADRRDWITLEVDPAEADGYGGPPPQGD